MATSQEQNVVLCKLCPNPAEHQCNLCNVHLCPNCILKHRMDRTKRHNVVEFINRGIFQGNTEFGIAIDAIQDQEDNICKVVRKIGSLLKQKVAKQKKEWEQMKNEVQSSTTKEEQELKTDRPTSRGILKSNDFKKGQKQPYYPLFFSGKVKVNQLQEMFGSLKRSICLAPGVTFGMKIQMSTPSVLSSIQTPYKKKKMFNSVFCKEREKIWISGSEGTIFQIDQCGSILEKITVRSEVFALSLNDENELTFTTALSDTKIYRICDGVVGTFNDLVQWYPVGLCHSANGDLLVSMRSTSQSRVVRQFGTENAKIIQNDGKGKPLFSVGVVKALFLAENGNGDICVADLAGAAVVVVNADRKLRFKYQGNLTFESNYKSFAPRHIATDVNHHILINDDSNDIAHVIDSDGNFLRYIEYPCNGGLSIDLDHNLVFGDEKKGIIRIIKYLQ